MVYLSVTTSYNQSVCGNEGCNLLTRHWIFSCSSDHIPKGTRFSYWTEVQ